MEQLFQSWAGEPCLNKIQITANGSNRLYFRLEGETKKCIGAFNNDVRENEAFFFFAKELAQRGIRVPQVYAVSDDRLTYLQEDLGNVTIYTYLSSRKTNGIDITEPMRELYQKAVDQLVRIQSLCGDIDFSHSYPRPDFDRQAIQWDLNYFKYYFLRMFHVPFDEDLLERDFSTFADYLLEGDCDCFMYRDFQSRNIMIDDNGELCFIDFQGARRGAPQYDLASLLFSSKADLPDNLRTELLEYYLDKKAEATTAVSPQLQKRLSPFNKDDFRKRFYAYVLARIMQAMGAYGFRGLIEKKDHFYKSIPFAVNNMRKIISENTLPIDIPHLVDVWNYIANMPEYNTEKERLTVSIFSFSYRKGIPFDKSGNGGGFVIDCRALPNPGLFDEYRSLTGRDTDVIDFFLQHPEMEDFLSHVRSLLDISIKSYLDRGYNRLMVCFGCTGGRHRSVYCAEQIAKFINANYDCDVSLHHLEQSKL